MDNFNEKLIQAVKERPILYDTRHHEYKNHFKRTSAWTDICNEIGGESGDAMKEKWKNLRDTYIKHKKSFKASSGQATNKLRNWIWATQMEFLDKSLIIRRRTTKGIPPTSKSETVCETTSSNTATLRTTPPTISPANHTTSNINIQQRDTGSAIRKRRNQDGSDKIIDNLSTKKFKKQDELDKTDFLFLHYADTFKRLTPRTQAILKFDLAKLFNEAELADLDELEKRSTTSYSIIEDHSSSEEFT